MEILGNFGIRTIRGIFTMIIQLKNNAVLAGIDNPQLIAAIKKKLTIPNPMFNKKSEMGFSTWDTPNQLKYYEQPLPTVLEIPIGALGEVLELCHNFNIKIAPEDIMDNRVDGANLGTEYFNNISFSGILRPYQANIIHAMQDKTIGIIEAMTGAGKTITFVKRVVDVKVPTLILVNTIELAGQTVRAFENFTNLTAENIGFIGNGKMQVKPITVALHQSMAAMNDDIFAELNKVFGQVIADEIHIIGAQTYFHTMSHLNAKYKFGFSATPKRDDGLTQVLHYASGPKIYIVPKEDLVDGSGEPILITPKYSFINTNYFFPIMDSKEYIELVNDLSIDIDRNALIADYLLTNHKNNYVCLLCNRQSQVDALKVLLGDEAVTLTSLLGKKDRKAAMSALRDKSKRHVISTFGLFSTGIDIPHLDTLYICAPIRSEVKLRQSAGRLMRRSDGKTSALIVDFIDVRVELLKNQARQRRKIFLAL